MLPVERIFPVVGGVMENGQLRMTQICGTAFSINNNNFLTANHVIECANTYEVCCILVYHLDRKIYRYYKIEQSESITGYDINLFKANVYDIDLKPIMVYQHDIFQLVNVHSVGYPHSFNAQDLSFHNRALMGYIVANRNLHELPKRPHGFELSFHCPKGISGAPLIYQDQGNRVYACGIIVGNCKAQIEVAKSIEIDEEANERTVHEISEVINFGLAVAFDSLLDITINLLGSSLREYLMGNKLIFAEHCRMGAYDKEKLRKSLEK